MLKMIKNYIISLCFIFLAVGLVKAQEATIFINEIAWMGTDISSTNEWIELYNNTNNNIALEGWTLKSKDGQPEINLSGTILAHDYFLLERTDDNTVAQKIASQIYVGSLSNAGEYLELIDSSNNLVDFIDMSASWLYGDNDTKQTMERVDGNSWQTSLGGGGSPAEKNSTQEELENTDVVVDTENEEEINYISEIDYRYADILINEIVSDPADGDTEWIELFNNTNEDIDLDSWYIKEGSDAKTILNGMLKANNYFVIESPKGNLNNSGDEVLLFSFNDRLINDLVYGEWNDGDISDNAPLASDPFSVARINNKDTRNNFNDFELTSKVTKGGANIILNDEDFVVGDIEDYDFGKTVIVSEIFPNPEGDDRDGEFIEIYNFGDRDINLFGWLLGDASKNRFEFAKGDAVKSGTYLVLYRSDTGIALNNTGDTVDIYQAGSENPVYTVIYTKSEEGFSFNNTKTEETENFYNKNFIENNWTWSENISPGVKNKFKLINHVPEIDFSFGDILQVGRPILFDSSDSFDEDGDSLTYHWNFGDGFENILENPEHTYFEAGVYNVVLEINDGENIADVEKILKVENNYKFDNGESKNIESINFGETKIYITEVLPNPDGDDNEGEFIEIYNAGEYPVSLFDWALDDMEGGSKPYKIESDCVIDAGEYFVINRTESGVVLNNSYDKVRLIDGQKNIVDEIEYQKTSNAKSYSKDDNGNWFWTEEISPGDKNSFYISGSDYSREEIFVSAGGEYFSQKSPREVQAHAAGQFVLAEGVVNSLPGMFSSQYFYIEGDGGVQIYSNKKDYPKLALGDLVHVRGEISKINNESRIKTKTKEDISIIDVGYTIEPIEVEGRLNSDYIGRLVLLKGEIIEKNSKKLVLANKNGEYNIEIKNGTDIDLKKIKEEDSVNLVGVVISTKNNYVIFPRTENDIEIVEENKPSESGTVLGEFSEDDEWSLEQKNNKKDYYFLLLYFFAVLILILIYKKTRK